MPPPSAAKAPSPCRGNGSIAASSKVTDNGTFDISATTNGASIQSLAGNGNVALGGKTLSLTHASDTFSGVIAGTGNVVVYGGTQTLGGTNTYTGLTGVDTGATLALSGTGSIAASQGLIALGTFDISGTSQGPRCRRWPATAMWRWAARP